jgi:hypothetical protein
VTVLTAIRAPKNSSAAIAIASEKRRWATP